MHSSHIVAKLSMVLCREDHAIISSGMTEVVQKAICQKLLITLPPLPRLPFRGLLLVGLIHSQKLSLIQNSVCIIVLFGNYFSLTICTILLLLQRQLIQSNQNKIHTLRVRIDPLFSVGKYLICSE